MKTTIRIISLMLALCFSVLAFSACDNGGEEKAQYVWPEGMFENLEQKDFGGETVTILVEGDYRGNYKSAEICAQEDMPEILYENVLTRNGYVESFLNVKIEETYVDNTMSMSEKVSSDIAAGLKSYDIVMPYVNEAANMCLENQLLLLNDPSLGIDLDAPYWDQNARNSLSINNKNYFLVGDASLLSLACTHAIIFNKDLITTLKLEDPYELVKSGKWTIDKLKEMAKAATFEVDGDGEKSYKDSWGFLVNSNYVTSMYIGTGNYIAGKDNNDYPYIRIFNETSTANAVYKKIAELVNDQTCCAKIDGEGPYNASVTAASLDVWKQPIESLASKLALFRAMSIIDIIDQGTTDCSFGILPTPKLSATQEKHYSNVSIIYVSTMAIPLVVKDAQMSALVMQAMNEASTTTTRYAYEQTILKERKIQDNESEAMFDDSFNGRVYDLGIAFNWCGTGKDNENSVGTFMNHLAFNGYTNLTVKLQQIKSLANAELKKTINQFNG
jgi:hypothetical protein